MIFEDTLARWLPKQRWYSGIQTPIHDLSITADVTLVDGDPGLRHLIVSTSQADGIGTYQVLAGFRSQLPASLSHAVIGPAADGMTAYDALHDPALAGVLLRGIAGQRSIGQLRFVREPGAAIDDWPDARVLSIEQSNTSVVFGESAILKVLRRPFAGQNPDLEVAAALWRLGSSRIAAPLGWIETRIDGQPALLAVLSQYLPHASDGWSLAVSGLRDLYGGQREYGGPGQNGVDAGPGANGQNSAYAGHGGQGQNGANGQNGGIGAYAGHGGQGQNGANGQNGGIGAYAGHSAYAGHGSRGRDYVMAHGAQAAGRKSTGRLAGGWIHEEEADPHFTGEAYLLGRATAEMHADLAAAFGTGPMPHDALAGLADRMTRKLEQASAEVPELGRHAAKLRASYADIARISGPVTIQRVHGDFHLGQVLRTQDGWVALDFEGEPAIPLAQRRARYPALKDVAGMLRSFDYAARHQLLGHPDEERLRPIAEEWVERCQAAFCAGYAHAGGMDPLANAALMRALMLEKAVYEVLYEARHRPAWMSIPLESIAAA
jgi:maltokinase